MRATKDRTASFSQPVDALFAAASDVVDTGKYKLTSRDGSQHLLSFSSGKTGLSWGQEYVVRAVASGSGSELQVTCGSLDDAPKAMLDGWKGGKAADKFIAAVQERLGA